MIALEDLPPGAFSAVHTVFTDLDDTLSTAGKLTAAAYDTLWRLHAAGVRVVIVSGRPAGWCDMIARMWPVAAVVGENGGFHFHHDGEQLRRRYLYDDEERAAFRARLLEARERILAKVPGVGIASDQAYREYDLAIDYCEDVPPLPRETAVRIQQLFEDAGAHAKISSIHVNGWFGDFDKLTTARLCAREVLGFELDEQPDGVLFCGDSPNDEPMFAAFRHSVGMANLRPYLHLMRRRPAYITQAPAGEGFVQVAERVLRDRA